MMVSLSCSLAAHTIHTCAAFECWTCTQHCPQIEVGQFLWSLSQAGDQVHTNCFDAWHTTAVAEASILARQNDVDLYHALPALLFRFDGGPSWTTSGSQNNDQGLTMNLCERWYWTKCTWKVYVCVNLVRQGVTEFRFCDFFWTNYCGALWRWFPATFG